MLCFTEGSFHIIYKRPNKKTSEPANRCSVWQKEWKHREPRKLCKQVFKKTKSFIQYNVWSHMMRNEPLTNYSQEKMSILQLGTQAKKMPSLWEEMHRMQEDHTSTKSVRVQQKSTSRENQGRQRATHESLQFSNKSDRGFVMVRKKTFNIHSIKSVPITG